MPLASGTRLGPYEIVAAIGVGGMGELYRAKDTRLGRTVAVKVLPMDLAANAGARERMEREARAISALNHPSICTLFDIGHEDGTDYLVMEFIDGVTLADRLQAGPLPGDEARQIAAQIASALAKAHERGVIHRDLKPGNIMLTKGDANRPGTAQVKLLDFGLAKLRESDTGNVLGSSAATRQALTMQGTIVGTLPYMAPEQMAGQAVDARSDLFSFGAVLYEMVTGQRAFSGDTPTAVMANVMGSQPASPRTVRPNAPVGLERLILTCLAKAPADRWQSAHDVALFLEAPQDTTAESASPRRRRSPWFVAAAFAGGAAIGMSAALGLWLSRPGAPAPQIARLSVPLASDGPLVPAYSPGAGASVAISRDGQRMVYVSQRSGSSILVLRRIDRAEESVLRGTEGAFSPFFSPDGRWVAYFTYSELKKVPLAGGATVAICATPPVTRGGTWADDDTIYFTPDFTSGLQQVPAAGGRPQELTTLDLAAREGNHLFPEVLPGGDAVLFTVWKGGSFEAASVWALSVRTGKRTEVLQGAAEPRYLPQGYLVFARAGALLAVPFDAKTLAVLGPAVPVVEGVWNDPTTGTANYAVSYTGTLVYAPGQYSVARRRIAWVDRRGRTEFLPLDPGFYGDLKLSPDGRRIAIHLLNDIWVYDIPNRTMTPTTFRGVNQTPVWTPDGRHITFSSSRDVTRPTLYWIDPQGGGDPEILSREGEVQFPASWSPDGKTLAYVEIKAVNPETDLDIWLLSGGGPWKRQRLIGTPFRDDQPMFSPDGRALAWVSNDTGRFQVYVRPYPGAGRTMVSTDGGAEPIWSPDGTELFYRKGRSVFAVPISTKGGVTVGRPALLFEGNFYRGSAIPGVPAYDVAPDGQRFIMAMSASDTKSPSRLDVIHSWDVESPSRLDLVINWVEDLKRLVPRRPTR